MTGEAESPQPPAGAEDPLDGLRRRLYRADATDADVQRYLAGRAATADDRSPERAAEEPPARRLPRRRVAVVVAAGAVTAALLAVVQLERSDVDPASPTAGPASERALVQDIGDGQVLAIEQGSVSSPTAVTTSVRGVETVGERFTGRGNAVVAVHPPQGSLRGGRARITVGSTGPTPAVWRALLVETRNEVTTSPVVMARGASPASPDVGTPTVFAYARLPPTLIAVAAATDVRWTLEVAVANGPRRPQR